MHLMVEEATPGSSTVDGIVWWEPVGEQLGISKEDTEHFVRCPCFITTHSQQLIQPQETQPIPLRCAFIPASNGSP